MFLFVFISIVSKYKFITNYVYFIYFLDWYLLYSKVLVIVHFYYSIVFSFVILFLHNIFDRFLSIEHNSISLVIFDGIFLLYTLYINIRIRYSSILINLEIVFDLIVSKLFIYTRYPITNYFFTNQYFQ